MESRREALATQWLFFESFSLSVHCGSVWWSDVVSDKIGRPGADPKVLAQAVEELERSLGVLEEHLASRPWLLGRSLSLPDCSVGVSIDMLRGTRMDQPERWPNVTAYRDRLLARTSWSTAGGEEIHRIG
jgi:glutathione S-transferase